MISSINYQEIEALFILVVVGEAWKVMVVSREIVSVPVISADHCNVPAKRRTLCSHCNLSNWAYVCTTRTVPWWDCLVAKNFGPSLWNTDSMQRFAYVLFQLCNIVLHGRGLMLISAW